MKVTAKDYVQFSSALNFDGLLHLLTIIDSYDFENYQDRFNLIAPINEKKQATVISTNNEAVIEKMVVGKLEKFYKEVVLTEQAFIKENKISIAQYVKDNNAEVLSMVRFAVGEGIEKRQENFAEEVMSQINAA